MYRYWTIANSWGTGWGQGGYGRFRKGTDEAGIEKEACYPKPALPSVCAGKPACKNGGNPI